MDDGSMDEWMVGGWMDAWMDGWMMDGWMKMEGWADERTYLTLCFAKTSFIFSKYGAL